jgi:hypothetical protein
VLNVIRSRASFLGGMEKKQRRDPKAYPRNNPDDVQAAEAFTDGLRYAPSAPTTSKRSQAWKNITIEGFGGSSSPRSRSANGLRVHHRPHPVGPAFYDPHSSEPDFSDARYFGQVLWMDYDEALSPRGATPATSTRPGEGDPRHHARHRRPAGRTYDDKPRGRSGPTASASGSAS